MSTKINVETKFLNTIDPGCNRIKGNKFPLSAFKIKLKTFFFFCIDFQLWFQLSFIEGGSS